MKNQKCLTKEGSSFKGSAGGIPRRSPLPTLINSRGDNLIKPTYRRVMKQEGGGSATKRPHQVALRRGRARAGSRGN